MVKYYTLLRILSGWTFRVSVEGRFAMFKNVLLWLPQGSVLGPLLADDLKLKANVSDNDLKCLEEWEKM